MDKQKQFVAFAAIFALLSSYLVAEIWKNFHRGWMSATLAGAGVVWCWVMSLACLHIASLRPANSHTFLTLIVQYLVNHIVAMIGNIVFSKVIKSCHNCEKAQEKVLLNILRQNEKTEYGKEHKFNQINTVQEYIQQHPLCTYSDFQPYIERIVDGEENVLYSDKTFHIAVSSGTTGKSKRIPISRKFLDLNVSFSYLHIVRTRFNVDLKRVVALRTRPQVPKNKNGVQIGPVSLVALPPMPFYVTPKPGYDITKEKPSLYVHAYFALLETELGLLEGIYSPLVYSFFTTIKNNWQQLCSDIENGQISTHIDLDPKTRTALQPYLTPDPKRAEDLRHQFSQGFDGIAKRIWPYCKNAFMCASGGFYNYTKLLEKSYLKGIPIQSYGHPASEGLIGVALNENSPGIFNLTLPPCTHFFELIEESECHQENPKTCLLHQAEIGKRYEIVLTNSFGLYRYRLGDVIQVVDYVGQCPVYEFQYRLGQLLNVASEKTSEDVFYQAIDMAVQKWPGVRLTDYTATESINIQGIEGKSHKDTEHYVLFVELERESDGADFVAESRDLGRFEDELYETADGYKEQRENGSIGPMRVIQVKRGTFQALKYHMIASTQNPQFKMPRVIRNEDHLRVLLPHYKNGLSNGVGTSVAKKD